MEESDLDLDVDQVAERYARLISEALNQMPLEDVHRLVVEIENELQGNVSTR